MQDTVEQIAALMRQEDKYECPDYLSPQWQQDNSAAKTSGPSAARVVQQVANLVTDPVATRLSISPSIPVIKSPSATCVQDLASHEENV